VIGRLEEKQDFDESIERDLTQAVKTWLAKHEAEAKK
jgi:hypothetical protein